MWPGPTLAIGDEDLGDDGAQMGSVAGVRVVSDRAVYVRLPDAPTSARVARRRVADVLLGQVDADTVYTAQMLVSEVVTNALCHAAPERAGSRELNLRIGVLPEDRLLRVELSDPEPLASSTTIAPPVAAPGALPEGGRGLHLVSACAKQWGVSPSPHGKSVWFELDLAP